MRKLLLFPLIAATLFSCNGTKESSAQKDDSQDIANDEMLFIDSVAVDSNRFMVIKMNDGCARIELADSVIPSINDSTIALCVEAAFTGELLDEFTPSNIAGDYVMNGVLRKGYKCSANTGFLYSDNDTVLIAPLAERQQWTDRAVLNNGTLFEQMMILHDGAYVYADQPIKPSKQDIYRSACVFSDVTFGIVQSDGFISLGEFIADLAKLNVKDALYLDMGTGWNYGWYRPTTNSDATLFFEETTPFQTNWLLIRYNN